MDNILSLINRTPESILRSMADRVKERRLEQNWTQEHLASKAGIPVATYRRFERQGEVSLRGLVMIAIALGTQSDMDTLFAAKSYQTIDDVINSGKQKQRKRAKRNG